MAQRWSRGPTRESTNLVPKIKRSHITIKFLLVVVSSFPSFTVHGPFGGCIVVTPQTYRSLDGSFDDKHFWILSVFLFFHGTYTAHSPSLYSNLTFQDIGGEEGKKIVWKTCFGDTEYNFPPFTIITKGITVKIWNTNTLRNIFVASEVGPLDPIKIKRTLMSSA